MTRFFKSILFCLSIVETTALAQRLVIETPLPGPKTRVIYGRLTTNEIWIFEKKYPLISTNQSQESSSEVPSQPTGNVESELQGDPAPKMESAIDPANQNSGQMAPSSSTMASFTLNPDDIATCIRNKRFEGFLQLINALRNQINSISISSSMESEACAANISRKLAGIFKDAQIETGSSNTDGVRIELGVKGMRPVVAATTSQASQGVKDSIPRIFTSISQVLKFAHITINNEKVAINSDGFFVYEIKETTNGEQATTMEYDVDVSVSERQSVEAKVFPITLTDQAAAVSGGFEYSARQAAFGQPALKIFVSETPFLARKTTIDGGLGGGVGYGREVPGERRGQRLVALLGVDRRQLIGDVGAKATLFYTSASATVVPRTYTARGLGYYDMCLVDDIVTIRVGAGMEIFSATIKKPSYQGGKPPQSVLIPSLVSVPLLSIGIHSVLFGRMIFAPTVVVTPLYVQNAGFYPSLSPAIELGFKFKKEWIAMAHMGYETHRFPSKAGETRLQLDYGLLTLKRGIF